MSFINTTLSRIAAPERRTMAVACGAHILHDGYTDLLYVLLPLWQAQFGLDYAAVGVLRALYVGAMAGFQIPAGAVAARLGGPLGLGPRPPPAGGGLLFGRGGGGLFLVAGGAGIRGGGARGRG